MDDIKRAQIEKIVDYFEGKAITQEAISDFCKTLKVDPPITKGELEDYTEQVKHDRIVGELFPKVLAELQNLSYVPEFASDKVRKEMLNKNDEVRVNITKLFENHGIKYQYVDNLAQELGAMISQTVTGAGNTAFNKALGVMLHLARAHFGGDFTMKHAKEYAEKVYGEGKKDVN